MGWRHRRTTFLAVAGKGEDNEINLWEQLVKYAINLLDHYEISEAYLAFAFSLLPTDKRKAFIDFFYGGLSKHEDLHYADCLQSLQDGDDLARNVIRDMIALQNKASTKKTKEAMRSVLMKCGSGKKNIKQDFSTDELRKLADLFQLNEEDLKIVYFLYCYSQSSPFEDLCTKNNFYSYLKLLSITTELPVTKVKKIITKQGRLVQSGIVDDHDSRHAPFITLTSDVIDYLSGINDVPLTEKYIKKDTGTTYPITTFNIPEAGLNIIKALLSGKAPCNILLYGVEGTGKTEFAKAVAAYCGKEVFFIQHGDDGSASDRRPGLVAATGTISPDKGVIIVDEADMVLNTEMMFFSSRKNMEKGWLNNFLDQSKAQIIWITNHECEIAGSVLRRFSYSWHFKKFTARERKNIWQAQLKDHPLKAFITDDMVRELSSRYQVNAGGIGSALSAITNMIKPAAAAKDQVHTALKELLRRHEALTTRELTKALNPLTEFYDISALNIDITADSLLSALKGFVNQKKQKDGYNMNLLFWGPPGTGKTEFAKYLAFETGMDLIIRKASDLLNCYVGETEKNIREAFDEAERQGAILFIDEADSFLSAREKANHSWEVTQTNELLTGMENHKGILICCTNLLHILDNASTRRFNWKIEFKPLAEEGKLMLYRKYFCLPQKPLTSQQERRIMAIPHLTPGDIKAVWLKNRFVPQDDLEHGELIAMIEREVWYRDREMGEKIGFLR